MRQQESNLFDKGMSLDTNPIAMDNHTLSGALNATMITMNGNELVLQNDMGNARVETAYLPDGFVPVGMKEYGGIVYVASYNPISDQSLIGSFPSPERNASNQDSGHTALQFSELDTIVSRSKFPTDDASLVKVTYGREAVLVSNEYEEDANIIRPGDQLAFYGSLTNGLKTYANLSAIIVDSDNNAIDISDNFLTWDSAIGGYNVPASQPTNIPYYKGKISGKVYLVETLKLPNYILVEVGGEKTGSGDNTKLKLTIKPTTDEDSKNFLGTYKFYVKCKHPEIKVNNLNTTTTNASIDKGCSCEISGLPLEGTVTYEVWLLTNYGRIASMYKSGSIDLAKVGTGDVEFKYFFYYNDIKREQIQFDYDVFAYLRDNEEISRCYLSLRELCMKDVDGWDDKNTYSNTDTPNHTHVIDLPVNSTSGNFSVIIPYGSGDDGEPASTLAMGKIYYGTFRVNTCLNGTETVKVAETPICVITSSCTNEYYMDHSTGNSTEGVENFMSLLYANKSEKIQLYADCNWTESSLNTISKETDIKNKTNDSPIISLNDDGYNNKTVIFYGKQLETNTVLTVTPQVKVLYPDESFPLDEEVVIECSNPNDSSTDNCNTYSVDISWTASNNSIRDTLSPTYTFETAVLDLKCTKKENGLEVLNTTYVEKLSQSTDGNRIDITFKNTLFTKFYGKLGAEDTYFDNDALALVSYMDKTDLNKARQLLATDVFLDDGDLNGSTIRPESWFSFETWESGKNDRNRKIAIMRCDLWYKSCEEAGNIPGQGDTNEQGGTTLFHTTSTNANWNFYSKVINDYYHNELNAYPSILFLSGANEVGTRVRTARTGNNQATNDYAIPVMFSTSGDLYMLNEIGWVNKNNHPLSRIIDVLSKIYVLLSGLVIELNYKKTEDYIYTMPYTLTVNVPIRAEVKLTFPNYPSTVAFSSGSGNNAISTTYNLPVFTLNPSDNNGKNNYDYVASYSIANPDVYSEIESYINAQLLLLGCALVPNGDNGSKVITQTIDSKGNKHPIDSSHPYYWDSANSKLIDCYLEDVAKSTNGIAYGLNQRRQYLVVKRNVDLDYNTIYVNKTAIKSILVSKANSNRSIGVDSGKETEFGDVAINHIIEGFFSLDATLKLN